jgi:hypothetical protein
MKGTRRTNGKPSRETTGIKIYNQDKTMQFLTSYSNVKNSGHSSNEFEEEENK